MAPPMPALAIARPGREVDSVALGLAVGAVKGGVHLGQLVGHVVASFDAFDAVVIGTTTGHDGKADGAVLEGQDELAGFRLDAGAE